MTKHYFVFILLLLFNSIAFSQRQIQEKVNTTDHPSVFLDFRFADQISIKGWDQDKILIKASVDINNNSDNEYFRLDKEDDKQQITFTSKITDWDKVRRQIITKKDNGKDCSSYTTELHINFEVFLPRSSNLKVKTINGDVIIQDLHKEIEINCTSGFIDFAIPKQKAMNFTIYSVSGRLYSDLDLKPISSGKSYYSSTKKYYLINDKGENIKLKSISGDIFIRKEKFPM